jgi:protein-S-isoprenylcysteine O-methyltransferase Ste14
MISLTGMQGFMRGVGWFVCLPGGLVMMVAGQQSLGNSLSPFPIPREDAALVTNGAYSYVRHPMYTGLLLVAFGLSVATGSAVRFLFSALLLSVLDKKVCLRLDLSSTKISDTATPQVPVLALLEPLVPSTVSRAAARVFAGGY